MVVLVKFSFLCLDLILLSLERLFVVRMKQDCQFPARGPFPAVHQKPLTSISIVHYPAPVFSPRAYNASVISPVTQAHPQVFDLSSCMLHSRSSFTVLTVMPTSSINVRERELPFLDSMMMGMISKTDHLRANEDLPVQLQHTT
ncbi:uncharacterized protein LOC135114442 isoform X2 [Scylla paramamosain]|uniref:uncharacterized protein LOC135114442 isoform X2 n=1 Tax=Scylla paramamosain TaxID=85552 RepID=UPI003082A31B